MSFPSGGLENQYRSNLRDVVRMLKSKHNNSYVVFNLSRRRHDVSKLNQEVSMAAAAAAAAAVVVVVMVMVMMVVVVVLAVVVMMTEVVVEMVMVMVVSR